ncbi:MAG: hypothetical protein LBF62_10270 [Tannerellaceae bacterium]|nr:hypothetical protein [Tannerellaceae bacterium]
MKGNQGNLLEQAEDTFRFLRPVSSDEQADAGHGQGETTESRMGQPISL